MLTQNNFHIVEQAKQQAIVAAARQARVVFEARQQRQRFEAFQVWQQLSAQEAKQRQEQAETEHRLRSCAQEPEQSPEQHSQAAHTESDYRPAGQVLLSLPRPVQQLPAAQHPLKRTPSFS